MRITRDCGTEAPRSRPLYSEARRMIIPRNAPTTPDCWDSLTGPTGVQPRTLNVNCKRHQRGRLRTEALRGLTGSLASDSVWAAQTQECRRMNAQVSMSRSSEQRRLRQS